MGGSARLTFLGRGTGSKRSGAVLACFWTDFQAKPSILDPIRTIFDDLGPNRHFGRDLDQARDWPGGLGNKPGTGREALVRPTKPEMPIWDLTPSE